MNKYEKIRKLEFDLERLVASQNAYPSEVANHRIHFLSEKYLQMTGKPYVAHRYRNRGSRG